MKSMILGAVASMIAGAGMARATVLLDLTNAPYQDDTAYSLLFVADASTTTISIGGYQIPSSEQATDNGVFLEGSTSNLLKKTWTVSDAASGSDTYTYNDGTKIPALDFAASVVGDYDTYSQTIATTPGDTYAYDFEYSNPSQNAPSGLLVQTTGGAVSAAPEPLTWALMLAGVGAMGLALRRAKTKPGIAFAPALAA